jgi:hypothetical protein
MQIRFSDQGDGRWAWTEGLTALGQQEIALSLAWPEGGWRDVER